MVVGSAEFVDGKVEVVEVFLHGNCVFGLVEAKITSESEIEFDLAVWLSNCDCIAI